MAWFVRRFLAAWLALVPAHPALASLAPPPSTPAMCTSHGCRCPRPAPAVGQKRVAARSCHDTPATAIGSACRHDPDATTRAGSAPYLVSPGAPAVSLAADAPVVLAIARARTHAAPGVDPPPPRPAGA